MSNGVNKVIAIGNLGADPEIRATNNGGSVANLRMAVSESWNDRQSGEKREQTEWLRVVMFGKLAEIAGEYLRKGSKIYIEGKIKTNKWTDKDGQDKYTTEIVANEMRMLGGKSDREDSRPSQHDTEKGNGYQRQPEPELDDGIPF